MKRLLLLVLCLMLAAPCAMAATVFELTVGVSFDAVDVPLAPYELVAQIPAALIADELSQQELDDGIAVRAHNEDRSFEVEIATETQTRLGLLRHLRAQEGYKGYSECLINEIDFLLYNATTEKASIATAVMGRNALVHFTFRYNDFDDKDNIVMQILGSLHAAE